MTKDLYQEITDKIVAELENGVLPWLKPWKDGKGPRNPSMPANYVSKRYYTGTNVLVLWSTMFDRGYATNKWITIGQANKLGGKVRKGEKGTNVFLMKPYSKTVKNDAGEDIEESRLFMRDYWVFNIEQTEGLKLVKENVPVQTVEERDSHLTSFIKSIPLDLRHGGDRAYYTTAGDYVQMPVYEAFRSPESYWATLFHETSHWTGHKSRLDRELHKGRFGDAAYAMEELVAELSSAFLCAEHSVEGELRHSSYIDSWLTVFKKDKKALFTAASAASKAAEYINQVAALANTQEAVAA